MLRNPGGTRRYLVTRTTVEEAGLFEALPRELKETITEVHFAEKMGMVGTYGIDLDDEWAETVRGASNLLGLLDVSSFGLGAAEEEPSIDEQPDADEELAGLPDPAEPGELGEAAVPPAVVGAAGAERRTARMWRVGTTLNQGNEGACVGFAGTHFLNAAPIPAIHDARYAFDLYEDCKRNDREPGEAYSGTTAAALRIVLQRRDLVRRVSFARSFEAARKWTLNRGGVIYVMDWYEGMYVPNAQGYIRPTGRKAGRHCIFGPGQNAWGARPVLPGAVRGAGRIGKRDADRGRVGYGDTMGVRAETIQTSGSVHPTAMSSSLRFHDEVDEM